MTMLDQETARRLVRRLTAGAPVERRVRLPALTPDQQKAMRHILANGDDLAMKGKRWQETKVELYRMGLLRRRIGDWAWIPTEAAKQPNVF